MFTLYFFIIFKSTLLYPVSQNALRSWWQQPLGKTWALQCQNEAMTYISRKTKSCRQHALFLGPVKLMLWISNLFLHLTEIARFQKHPDGLLTDMQMLRWNIVPCKKKLGIHSFDISYWYTIFLTKHIPIWRIFFGNLSIFF